MRRQTVVPVRVQLPFIVSLAAVAFTDIEHLVAAHMEPLRLERIDELVHEIGNNFV